VDPKAEVQFFYLVPNISTFKISFDLLINVVYNYKMKKKKNPFKHILASAKSAQAWNAWHQTKNVNRPVKSFSIDEHDVERIFNQQQGLSKWLKIPMNPEDVFRKHFPLAPSLDRLDNSKDYTVDNVCISTRFENWGFNRAADDIKLECVERIRRDVINSDVLSK
jgi:hypothetical protein